MVSNSYVFLPLFVSPQRRAPFPSTRVTPSSGVECVTRNLLVVLFSLPAVVILPIIGMGTVDAMPGLALAGLSLICLVLAVLMASPGEKHQLVFVFGALCALALGKALAYNLYGRDASLLHEVVMQALVAIPSGALLGLLLVLLRKKGWLERLDCGRLLKGHRDDPRR